jgi:ABC-2 type transport system ATP-binding protein
MRRRLDLAAALVGRPELLFLDEPTTGLDPRGRLGMWDVIRDQVREGTTLLLTTQYLEEADELADDIAVVDHGRIIARGTADELKAQVGGERIEVVVRHPDDLRRAVATLAPNGDGTCDRHTRRVTVAARGGAQELVEVVKRLGDASVEVDDVGLRRPTLDDVFLTLTGHVAEEGSTGEDDEDEPDEELAA